MAKPGSNGARHIAGGVDLRVAAMSDEEALDAQAMIELELGMRCHGCGRRVSTGMRFRSIAPKNPKAPVIQLTACAREDCDFAEEARRGATVVEMIEFAWLDELGLDAPAIAEIVERTRLRRERQAQAADQGSRPAD